GCSAQDAEGDIAAQLRSERRQFGASQSKVSKFVKQNKRPGRVGASPAQAGADGNPLFERELHARQPSGKARAQQRVGPQDKVLADGPRRVAKWRGRQEQRRGRGGGAGGKLAQTQAV